MFLDLIGFTMVFVDIQFRAEELGGVGWMIGGILASTFVLQTIFSPIWGRWSDRIGRKRAFVITTSLSAFSILLYGLADSLWLILLSRMLAGLGGANVAIAQASLTDFTDKAKRTVILGRLGAAQMAGMVAGPAFGGFVASVWDSRMVGLIGAGASATGVLLVLFFAEMRGKDAVYKKKPWGFGPLFKQFPKLVPLVILAGVAWFSLSTLEGTFGRLILHLWGMAQREMGVIFGFESLVGVVVQGVVLAWLMKKLSERTMLSGGYLLQGLGLAMTPFVGIFVGVPIFISLMVASLIYAAGAGVANATLNGLASQAVDEDSQGELFGVLHSARSIGFVFGPILGGILFDWRPQAPYVLAGGVCLLAAVLVVFTIPRGVESETA